MNEMNVPRPASAVKSYPGTLAFYHPNGSASGSAVRFELKPAIGNRDGCFFMEMARQKTTSGRNGDGSKHFASFDWQGKLTVKLGLTDVCGMLLVLRGRQEETGNGKGLFHDTAEASTVIRLRHGADLQGYALEVSRKAKQGNAEPVRVRLVLTEGEALALTLVFEQAMLLLVYGLLTPEQFGVPPAAAQPVLHQRLEAG